MIKVSVIGATGYAGIELVRLLNIHPKVKIMHLTSHSFSGKKLKDIYPNFLLWDDSDLESLDIEKIAQDSDVVFVCLPHGASSKVVFNLYNRGLRVIDLSGEFRYKIQDTFEKWYDCSHPYPKLLEASVYGLPELYKNDIKQAKLIGNPGCYPTGAILGLAPLISSDLLSMDSLIIDAKSGTTGAGRASSTGLSFSEVEANTKAYNIARHRHTSEIEEKLGLLSKSDITLSFTPHLIPVKRGILSTIYAGLIKPLDFRHIYRIYKEFYKDHPFISIYSEGKLPEIKYVNGSNECHIGFVIDPRTNRVIIVTAIDNLIKGASGQAIQNMNIMLGLDEDLGLPKIGWYL